MRRLTSARGLLAGVACVLAFGCAAPEKYVLPITVPSATTPASGPAIVLEEVVDAREFLPGGSERRRHLHQMATDGVGQPDVEGRVYAQMRRPDGSVVYDFVLPPGESVASVTRQALTAGFRKAGYRVLPAETAGADAPRVRAEIERFWSWNGGRDRTWFSFEAKVRLTGVTLGGPDGNPGEAVEASVSLDTLFTARPQAFVSTTSKGIEQFVARLTGALNR